MARTIGEIYDALNLVKGGMQELGVYVNNDQESIDTAKKLVNDVRTASKVAVWRLWLWIVACGSWVIENYQDIHEAKITKIIDDRRPHQLPWYANESKKFQYGHEIEWMEDHYGYALVDEDSQIVKYASAIKETVSGIVKLMIKVMKTGKEPLTTGEKNAFVAFWNRWGDAGIDIEIVSIPINQCYFTVQLWRDRNILNADNTLILDPSINVVERGCNGYLDGVGFDGLVYIQRLEEAMKNQPGIANADISPFHIDAGTWPGGSDGSLGVNPASGFVEIDWSLCTFIYIDSYA
jgi:hypothetical protein